jgi:hypothetical protein
MEPVRLDPADPFASVLRWLAALAQALGIDPARSARGIGLSRCAAALVRGWLADWSRQLRTLVRTEAARLARSLRPDVTRRAAGAAAAPSPVLGVAAASRRFRLAEDPVAASARRLSIPRQGLQPKLRPARDALLDPAAEAALERRARAVFAALRDPSAAVRRLARRFAKRLARASAAEAARRGRRRFPHPQRAAGSAPLAFVQAPDPRPPDRPASARPAARPTAPVAAAPALV